MTSKVFISWSSEDPRVQKTAEIFKNWFNDIFEGRIHAFFSEEIDPGSDFRRKIDKEIKESQFAFFFLSRRTSKASWVVYEAGCLSNLLNDDKGFFLLTDISIPDFKRFCPPSRQI
jgi:hypothetical protein